MACSNPTMMRAPTVGRFRGTRTDLFDIRFVFGLVFTHASYFFAFMACSALLKGRSNPLLTPARPFAGLATFGRRTS